MNRINPTPSDVVKELEAQNARLLDEMAKEEAAMQEICSGLADIFQALNFPHSHHPAYHFRYAALRGDVVEAADIARDLFHRLHEAPPVSGDRLEEEIDERVSAMREEVEEAEYDKEAAEDSLGDAEDRVSELEDQVYKLEKENAKLRERLGLDVGEEVEA